MWTDTGDGDDGREVDRDGLLLTLAHRRRRRVLFYLYDVEDTLTLWDLAVRIAAEETDVDAPNGNPPSEDIERVHLSLYHRHVPKLADAGLVGYDDDSELVDLADLGFRLEPRLREFVAPGDEPLLPDLSGL